MWKGNIGSSVATSTTQSDWTFVGDTHWDGTQLGDRVKNISNKYTSASARGYENPGYVIPRLCAAPGFQVGPYALSSPTGLSSFTRGC
jgi:hypothetical protein